MTTPPRLAVTRAEQAATKALAARYGDRPAARMLGVEYDSLLRVLLGRPLRRGTVLLLRAGLAAVAGTTGATP